MSVCECVCVCVCVCVNLDKFYNYGARHIQFTLLKI